MVYPNNFEEKINFSGIRDVLAEKCLSEAAREKVLDLHFLTDFEELSILLRETAEMMDILKQGDDLPIRRLPDLREVLQRVSVEGMYLEGLHLYQLMSSLEQVKMLRSYVSSYHGVPLPLLKKKVEGLAIFSGLITYIARVVDAHGGILDSASKELAEIRSVMRSEQISISRKLDGILRKAKASGWTEQDMNPAMRDGRLVIPVEAASKRKIAGIVHDESGTGKTAFVEPAEIVEANNKLKDLQAKERREIIKILVEICDGIRPHIEHIIDSLALWSEFDFIRAKAVFARQMDAVLPRLLPYAHVDWKEAVHPLLDMHLQKENKRAVPLDISLKEDARIVLISGPNAGGKSVCLKTLGLLQYMLQVGLLVPMNAESSVGIFEDIFIDIGDEQSIDNDLSTYSSHLKNMKHFLRFGTEKSMVLIDEFGTGTEPQIGGAIAEGILLELNKKQVMGLVSTHYANLKHCAAETEGIVNGAMLYDQHRMQALFRLELGNPGSSFAVEIARKIGLPENIIKEAEQKLGEDTLNFDKYLREIVRDKAYWGRKRENIRRQNKQLEHLVERYSDHLQQANKEEKAILAQARVEAAEIIKSANATIERTVRSIKEAKASKEVISSARVGLQQIKDQLSADTERSTEKELRKLKKHLKPKGAKKQKEEDRALRVKDKVRLLKQGGLGEIVEIKGDRLVLALGAMKVQAKLKEVERVSETAFRQQSKMQSIPRKQAVLADYSKKKLNFKPYIDVRGMRGEEGVQVVSSFLDDALMVGCKEVRILHGTGTGALRLFLRQFMEASEIVRDVRDEHVQQGGAGISVVTLL